MVSLEHSLSASAVRSASEESDLLMARFFAVDSARLAKRTHTQQQLLSKMIQSCDRYLEQSFGAWTQQEQSRVVALCVMAQSELLNYQSAFCGYFASQRLEAYLKFLKLEGLSSEERLYVEGRIYSSLPPMYGQNFKKALVSLQMLKRMRSGVGDPEQWIHHIQLLQGRTPQDEKRDSLAERRAVTDGFNFGIFPLIYATTSQGLGLQVRLQDDRIFDTARSFRIRLFATHRLSLGAEWRYDDKELLEDTSVVLRGNFLYGIQEFHGLGIQSGNESTHLYHTQGNTDLYAEKRIYDLVFFRLGWQLHSAHLRRLEEGPFTTVAAMGASNAFDSGASVELGIDSRDSFYDPYVGRLLSLRAYFPVQGILSSYTFEKWSFSWDEYLRLGLRYTLRLSLASQTASDNVPYWGYAQLSGSFNVPVIGPSRYQDRSALAAWAEMRVREWDPVTLLGILSTGTVAGKFQDLFHSPLKGGYGLGGEVRLSRFRMRAVRAEVGYFGAELVFKAALSIPIE